MSTSELSYLGERKATILKLLVIFAPVGRNIRQMLAVAQLTHLFRTILVARRKTSAFVWYSRRETNIMSAFIHMHRRSFPRMWQSLSLPSKQ